MSIAALNDATPAGSANAGGGAGELRALKTALTACFGGVDGPVKQGVAGSLATAAQLTALFDRLTAIEAQAERNLIGTIRPYYGALSALPAGWALCDGTGGTPNLIGRFPLGCDDTGGLPTIFSQTTGGEILPAGVTGSSGSVSAGTTGGTSLTVANLPDIPAALDIKHTTGSDGINHNATNSVAGGEGSPVDRPLITGTGFNGTPHTHTIPAVAAHTHTTPAGAYPPWHAVYWIIYLGA